MLKVLVGYPARDEELHDRATPARRGAGGAGSLSLDELRALQRAVGRHLRRPRRRRLRGVVAEATRSRRRAALRSDRYVAFGASPRGPISLVPAARALALVRGREYVLAEDVAALAKDALRHRLVLSYQALAEEVTPDTILERCMATVPRRDRPPPRARPDRSLASPDGPDPGPAGARAAARALLRALDIQIGRRVDALLAGDYRSAVLGVGSELAQVRPYVPGDDVRRIDWNVTARTREPHVRVQIAERVLVTWLVLDTRPRWASARPTGARRTSPRASRSRSGTSRADAATGSASSPSAPAGRCCRRARAAPGCSACCRAPRGGRAAPRRRAVPWRRAARAAQVARQRCARRRRLRLPRPARLADAAARARRPPRRPGGRDPGPARAGAAERRRAQLVDPETGRQLRVDTPATPAPRALRAAAAEERAARRARVHRAGVRPRRALDLGRVAAAARRSFRARTGAGACELRLALWLLVALLVVPLGAGLYVLSQRRRKLAASRFATAGTPAERRRSLRPALGVISRSACCSRPSRR